MGDQDHTEKKTCETLTHTHTCKSSHIQTQKECEKERGQDE